MPDQIQIPPKMSKLSVHYEHPAKMLNRRCELCMYFQQPNSCTIVRGRIDPNDWCNQWKKKGNKGNK